MAAVRIDYGFAAEHPMYEQPIPPEVTEIRRLNELLDLPSLGGFPAQA
jgi:hypothetical protein